MKMRYSVAAVIVAFKSAAGAVMAQSPSDALARQQAQMDEMQRQIEQQKADADFQRYEMQQQIKRQKRDLEDQRNQQRILRDEEMIERGQ
jgi:septal ring factor EnvC (AmiA/AmiB activator)